MNRQTGFQRTRTRFQHSTNKNGKHADKPSPYGDQHSLNKDEKYAERPSPYQIGEWVILLEYYLKDGNSICTVKKTRYFGSEWRYDLIIMENSHYGSETVGDIYHGASEHRLAKFIGNDPLKIGEAE